MKYDFTSVIERKGKDALAVDICAWPVHRLPPPQ